jgi:hypothetical protein
METKAPFGWAAPGALAPHYRIRETTNHGLSRLHIYFVIKEKTIHPKSLQIGRVCQKRENDLFRVSLIL